MSTCWKRTLTSCSEGTTNHDFLADVLDDVGIHFDHGRNELIPTRKRLGLLQVGLAVGCVMNDQLILFENELLALGHSESTVRAYVSDVRGFLSQYAQVDEDTIAKQMAQHLNRTRKTHSASTVRRHASSLRAFARLMHSTDALTHYRTPVPAAGMAHPLPNGIVDLRAVLFAAHRRHQPLIALCGFVGARVSEARKTTRGDISQHDDGSWWIKIYGKGSKMREVPVVEEALPWLHVDPNPPGGEVEDPKRLLAPFSDRAARLAITTAGERARISRPISSHDLRHTFASATYSSSMDIRTVQELLGHSSPNTTVRYTDISSSRKLDVANGAFS